jgi:hypothetical protein
MAWVTSTLETEEEAMAARRWISRVMVASAAVAALAVMAAALLVAAPRAAAAPGDRLWVRTYPAGPYVEEFRDLAAGPKRSVYAVGVAQGTEETGKLLVVRYSPDGARLWTRQYGAGGSGAYGFRALAVADGVIVVGSAGNVSSPHKLDIVVIKYSATGRRLWTTRYDGPGHKDDTPAGIVHGYYSVTGELVDVYVGGTSVGDGTGRDYVVLKIHLRSGRTLWTRRYDGPAQRDVLTALAPGPRGRVYVTGESEDAGGSTAAATIAYEFEGSRLWTRRLHAGAGPTSGAGIVFYGEDDPGIYVAGTTTGGMSTGDEIMLARLGSADGAVQSVQTVGVTNGNERALAFAANGVHGVAIAGETVDRGTGDIQGFVATWDQFGAFMWQKTFTGGLPTDRALFDCVAYDSAGGVYCGGFSAAGGTAEDFAVVRYDADGGITWSDAYDGAAHGTDFCRDILVRGTGIYAGGYVGKGGMNTSALLIKYAR